MTEPADVTARSEVLRRVATRSSGTLRPPVLVSAVPLRPLSAGLAALGDQREQHALSRFGSDYPRRESWQVTLLPMMVLGILAALVAIIAAALSDGTTALIALIVFLACLILGIMAALRIAADPLRVRREQRLELLRAGNWQSRQDWVPPYSAGQERALVDVAVEIVGGLAGAPGPVAVDGLPFSAADALDQIDATAHQIAGQRAARADDPEAQQAWDLLVGRVAALLDPS